MLYREYKTFGDCFLGINKEALNNPDIAHYMSSRVLFNNLIIKVDNTNCDGIDLGKLAYKKGKWPHLLRTYVDMDKLKQFYKEIQDAKVTTFSFDFNTSDTGKGGCIKSMVFTRNAMGKKKFNSVKIIWRTTELMRKFAPDLIMIARILEQCPMLDLDEIILIIPQAYHSVLYMVPFTDVVFDFNIDTDCKPKKYPYHQQLINRSKWFRPGHEPCKRQTTYRLQEWKWAILNGWQPEPVTYKDCELPL
ncbi:MAG: hypothetical protein ACRCR2_08060 [Fusobacteriaceae bacterium]